MHVRAHADVFWLVIIGHVTRKTRVALMRVTIQCGAVNLLDLLCRGSSLLDLRPVMLHDRGIAEGGKGHCKLPRERL